MNPTDVYPVFSKALDRWKNKMANQYKQDDLAYSIGIQRGTKIFEKSLNEHEQAINKSEQVINEGLEKNIRSVEEVIRTHEKGLENREERMKVHRDRMSFNNIIPFPLQY